MNARLVLLSGSKEGSSWTLSGASCRIGRNPDNDVVFDPYAERAVSRNHARIDVVGPDFVLSDVGSTTGTFVNGLQVQRHVLCDGDLIEFGQGGPRARFEAGAAPAPEPDGAPYATTGAAGGGTVYHHWERAKAAGGSQSAIIRRAIGTLHETSKKRTRRLVAVVGTLGLLATGSVFFLGSRRGGELARALEAANDSAVAYRARADSAVAAQHAREADLERQLQTASARLASLAATNRREGRVLRQRIDSLRAIQRVSDSFRDIAAKNDRSLIYLNTCTFLTRGESRIPLCGEGTGFIIDAAGTVVTNKHVIMPWLTEPDVACRVAFWGQQGYVLGDPHVFAWKVGDRFLGGDGNIDFSSAYSTRDGRLTLLGVAPNHAAARRRLSFECQVQDPESGRSVLETVTFDWEVPEDRVGDLAALRLAGSGHRPVAQQTRRPQSLDPVMAFGFPLGSTPLEGDRVVPQPTLGEVRKVELTIQHSAPISPGNSGGPLFALDGTVVGVNVAHFQGQMQNIAIPIEHARALVRRLGG